MLDKNTILTLILLSLSNLMCLMIYLHEVKKNKTRDKYWKEEYEKAAQNFWGSATAECTVTVEDKEPWENCDDECYMCDYENKCKESLAIKE